MLLIGIFTRYSLICKSKAFMRTCFYSLAFFAMVRMTATFRFGVYFRVQTTDESRHKQHKLLIHFFLILKRIGMLNKSIFFLKIQILVFDKLIQTYQMPESTLICQNLPNLENTALNLLLRWSDKYKKDRFWILTKFCSIASENIQYTYVPCWSLKGKLCCRLKIMKLINSVESFQMTYFCREKGVILIYWLEILTYRSYFLSIATQRPKVHFFLPFQNQLWNTKSDWTPLIKNAKSKTNPSIQTRWDFISRTKKNHVIFLHVWKRQ